MRPKIYLFPGTVNGWRADKPVTPKVIWEAVQWEFPAKPNAKSGVMPNANPG